MRAGCTLDRTAALLLRYFLLILFCCHCYTLYIISDVEVFQFVGDDEILLWFLQVYLHQSLDADAHFRASGHQFLVEFRVLQLSEDLPRFLLFLARRVLLGGNMYSLANLVKAETGGSRTVAFLFRPVIRLSQLVW